MILFRQLLLITLMLLTTIKLHSEEVDYEQLINLISNKQHSISVPLVSSESEYGEITVTLAGDTLLYVDGAMFANQLPINIQSKDAIKSLTSNTGELFAADIERLDFIAKFDPSNLSLSVTIPLKRMALSILSYRNQPLQTTDFDNNLNTDYSFYANFRYGQTILENTAITSDQNITKSGSIDSALSINGWVLESGVNYSDSLFNENTEKWKQIDTRISHDYKDLQMRFMAGDLIYPVTGFQSYNSMAGFSLSKNKHLDPYRVSQPTGHESFQLQQASSIEILVNNRLVRRLYLLRGNYKIQDLPGVTGINDVIIRVIGPTGEIAEYDYSFIFNQQLLAKEEHDYSYNIGVFRNRPDNQNRYSETAYFSGFHNYGFNNGITAGANAQITQDHQLIGIQSQVANLLGAFSYDFALSHKKTTAELTHTISSPTIDLAINQPPMSIGSASRLQYRYENYDFGSLSASWQYFTPYFFVHNNQYNLNINSNKQQWLINYSRAINRKWVVGITRRNIENRLPSSLSRRLDLNISSRIFKYLRFGLQLSEIHTEGSSANYEGVLTLSWQHYISPNTYDFRYESQTHTSNINHSYRANIGAHNFKTQLSHRQNDNDESQLSAGVIQYGHSRIESSLAYEQFDIDREQQIIRRFDAASSIVMANNHWSISRPVSNSFIIVDSDVALASNEFIGVNPISGGDFESRITPLLPAVLTSTSPYYINRVYIDGNDTLLEYQNGADQLNIVTSYKSGRLALIKSDNKINLSGRLIDPTGAPIKLQVADWINIRTNESNMFFTNEQGEFSIQNVNFGEYMIRMYQIETKLEYFSINKKMKKMHNLGDLIISPGD